MLRLVALAVVVAGCNCQPPVITPLDGGGGGVAGGSAGGTAGGGTAGGGATFDGGDLPIECAATLTRDSGFSFPCTLPGFQCWTSDFACTDFASCEIGGVYVSRTCRDAGTIPCFPFAAGTAVTGTTPLGAIDFRSAWGSPSWAFAHDLILQLANTPTAEYAPVASLGVFTGIDPSGDAGFRNVARLVLDGGVAFAPITVFIDGVDAGHAHGFISITAPGWSVSGPFDAPMCPQLDRSGP